MDNIKSTFSIKDLENLSGIKAHTIRIWEKRYNLLKPNRTDTNIRYYTISSLQKLLNISYLNNNGYKISKIASLNPDQISLIVKETANKISENHYAVNDFKLSMLNFDLSLFQNTYNDLINKHSFREVFVKVFIPLLEEIGLLWQTDTITPAHEHFITELIKQKILVNTEGAIQNTKIKHKERTYVLFLPSNEIHELGLQYLNYELISNGYQSLYLGPSVPTDSLLDLLTFYKSITFVTSFTIRPLKEDIEKYIEYFTKSILNNKDTKLWITGTMSDYIDSLNNLNTKIKTYKSVKDIVKSI